MCDCRQVNCWQLQVAVIFKPQITCCNTDGYQHQQERCKEEFKAAAFFLWLVIFWFICIFCHIYNAHTFARQVVNNASEQIKCILAGKVCNSCSVSRE